MIKKNLDIRLPQGGAFIFQGTTLGDVFPPPHNVVQDTLDIRLPQGGALIFQQKGTLHAGLGKNWKLSKDVKKTNIIVQNRQWGFAELLLLVFEQITFK